MSAAPPDWIGFRELDRSASAPKGSAFRTFKSLAAELVEGADFVVLRPDADAAQIDALRLEGRIYASTVNLVLLAPAAAARVRAAMG